MLTATAHSVVIPSIILAGVNAYRLWKEHWEHWEHGPALEDKVEYPFQNIRTKNYFWGDGDKVCEIPSISPAQPQLACMRECVADMGRSSDPLLEPQGQLPQEGGVRNTLGKKGRADAVDEGAVEASQYASKFCSPRRAVISFLCSKETLCTESTYNCLALFFSRSASVHHRFVIRQQLLMPRLCFLHTRFILELGAERGLHDQSRKLAAVVGQARRNCVNQSASVPKHTAGLGIPPLTFSRPLSPPKRLPQMLLALSLARRNSWIRQARERRRQQHEEPRRQVRRPTLQSLARVSAIISRKRIEQTHLRQRRFNQLPRGPKLPDIVQNARQLHQRLEQDRHKSRSLSAAGCPHGDAEALLRLAGGGEDARFERQEVEGLREVCARGGQEGGDFGERGGQLEGAGEERYFEQGGFVREVGVGGWVGGAQEAEVVGCGGEVVAGEGRGG